jgi:hypothetical protein
MYGALSHVIVIISDLMGAQQFTSSADDDTA